MGETDFDDKLREVKSKILKTQKVRRRRQRTLLFRVIIVVETIGCCQDRLGTDTRNALKKRGLLGVSCFVLCLYCAGDETAGRQGDGSAFGSREEGHEPEGNKLLKAIYIYK
jgi:hypothetical protein